MTEMIYKTLYLLQTKKKCMCFVFLFLLLFNCQKLFAINTSDTATIDIPLAISLHPKMALFDFNRIGFYRLNFGFLNYEDFLKAADKLKSEPRDNISKIKELEKELDKVTSEASDYQLKNYDNDDMETYRKNMSKFNLKQKKLRNEIENLKWEMANSDLTTREETKKILAEIRKDIIETAKEVALENKYKLVLNTTVIVPRNFMFKNVDLIYTQGIPGVNFSIFYAFYLYTNLMKPDLSEVNDCDIERWLKLTRKTDAVMPITNYPVVLAGGRSITSEVLKKIYNKKYNIDDTVFNIVANAVSRIESIQFGKPIEKLEVIGEEQ